MSRVFSTGFEIGVITSNIRGAPDGAIADGSCSVVTGGRNGKRVQVNAAGGCIIADEVVFTNKTFFRGYFSKPANPSAATELVLFTAGLSTAGSVRIETDGTLTLRTSAGVQVGSASPALANDTWYCVEYGWDVSGSNTVATLRLNSVEIASGQTQVSPQTVIWVYLVGLSNQVSYWDDCVVNTGDGSVHNSWPGEGKVLLLSPISESQDGTWLLANASGVDQWEALNNTPPTGALASDANRMESSDSSGDNATDEYRCALTTYTNAGIGSTDKINALHMWIVTGEEVATGTKSIKYGHYANPSGSLNTVADVTNGTSGAVGTYPAGWWWWSAITENPTVTLSSSPEVNIRKTDTTTRTATICGLFIYADVSPGLVPLVTAPRLPT